MKTLCKEFATESERASAWFEPAEMNPRPGENPLLGAFFVGASAPIDLLVGVTESDYWGWQKSINLGFVHDRLALASYFWNACDEVERETDVHPKQQVLFK